MGFTLRNVCLYLNFTHCFYSGLLQENANFMANCWLLFWCIWVHTPLYHLPKNWSLKKSIDYKTENKFNYGWNNFWISNWWKNSLYSSHCTQVDVVAIKMKCCNKFYACIKCHDEMEEHQAETWSKSEFDDKVVLCGNCRCEMTVNAYLFLKCCPDCDHEFNDKCKNHFHYYFDPWKGKRKVSWRLVKHFCYFFLLAFYFHPIDFNGWLFFN